MFHAVLSLSTAAYFVVVNYGTMFTLGRKNTCFLAVACTGTAHMCVDIV